MDFAGKVFRSIFGGTCAITYYGHEPNTDRNTYLVGRLCDTSVKLESWVSGTDSAATAAKTTYGVISVDSAKGLLQKAKVGDIIVTTFVYTNGTSNTHTMVVNNVSSTGLTLYQSNYVGSEKISLNSVTWNSFYTMMNYADGSKTVKNYGTISLYRARNYDSINGSSSSEEATTPSASMTASEYLALPNVTYTNLSVKARPKNGGSLQVWKLPWTDTKNGVQNASLKLTTVSGTFQITKKVVNHAGNIWYECKIGSSTVGYVYSNEIILLPYGVNYYADANSITTDTAKLYVTWMNPGNITVAKAGFRLKDSSGNVLKSVIENVASGWQTKSEIPGSHEMKTEYNYPLQPNTTYYYELFCADSSGNPYDTVTGSFKTKPLLVTGLSVSPATVSLNIGKSQQLTASVTPSNASNKNVTWKSSNTSVATVSASGVVTAKAIGTATITATAADGSGKSATATITVTCNHSSGTVTIPAVAPTCTATGLTAGKKCSACGAVTQAQTVVAAKGHTEVTDKAVAPTCLASGLTEGKHCSVCNTILVAQKEVSAKGHTPVTDPAVAATCSSTGLTEGKHCSVCGTVTQAQTVTQKLPHTEEVIPGTLPSCSATGLTDGKKCSACGETLVTQTVIPTTEHTPVTDSAVDATCTASGLTAGVHCDVCGHTITAQQVIPAQGHNEEAIPAVDATCVATGLTEGKKCTVCGTVTQAQTVIPATGHSWNEGVCSGCGAACDHDYGEEDGACSICGNRCDHSYESKVTTPSCTAQGYTTYTCTVCGNAYNSDYVKELGHSWVEATCTAPKTCGTCGATEGDPNGHSHTAKVTAPTCTEKGYTTYTCSCGDSYKDNYVDSLGHTPDASVEENRVEATCSAPGSYDTVCYCAVCEEELSRVSNTIPKKPHNYTHTVVAPGCNTQGYTEHKCQCGDSYKDTYTDATGHTAGVPVKENVKEANCIVSGTYDSVVYCGSCGTELSREQKEIPATGHKHSSTVTAPTCNDPGYTTYKCACGDTYTDNPTPPTGHKMGDWEEDTVAQCLTPGKSISRCQNKGCQYVEEKEIPATNHDHKAVVTAPTCTADGFTTYTCHCGDSYKDAPTSKLGHDMGAWTVTTQPTASAKGKETRKCTRCDYSESREVEYKGNVLKLEGKDLQNQTTVWINGLPVTVQGTGSNRYVELPTEDTCYMVTYTWHIGDSKDVHTQYPTGMKVYKVSGGKATHIPELDNLLQYSGASIRITGKKGIRMITSLDRTAKNTLTGNGLASYKLEEYGTVLAFASEVKADGDLVLGKPYSRSNYAYKKGIADPVFAYSGNLVQYTNVLVGFNLDQCKEDIAMRPYIILSDASGNKITLYGGTVYRSVGYIAYQNRNVFQPKTASYNYVWEIIHHVYGKQYDKDYKG